MWHGVVYSALFIFHDFFGDQVATELDRVLVAILRRWESWKWESMRVPVLLVCIALQRTVQFYKSRNQPCLYLSMDPVGMFCVSIFFELQAIMLGFHNVPFTVNTM